MSKAGKLVIALVIVVIIAIGGFMLLSGDDKKKDDSNATTGSSATPTPSPVGESAPMPSPAAEAIAVTITYNGNSFSSSASTMKAGGKVKVVNQSNVVLDFDSDPHPVHTNNTELNVGDIEPGQSKTFTIAKTGTWGYHNHLNARQSGSITVE